MSAVSWIWPWLAMGLAVGAALWMYLADGERRRREAVSWRPEWDRTE